MSADPTPRPPLHLVPTDPPAAADEVLPAAVLDAYRLLRQIGQRAAAARRAAAEGAAPDAAEEVGDARA